MVPGAAPVFAHHTVVVWVPTRIKMKAQNRMKKKWSSWAVVVVVLVHIHTRIRILWQRMNYRSRLLGDV